MGESRFSEREVEDLLAGRRPAGRADLAPLAELAALLHASREVEPAPPMSAELLAELHALVPSTARAAPAGSASRPAPTPEPPPAEVVDLPVAARRGLAGRRSLLSLGAAAAVLVGVVLAAVHGAEPREVGQAGEEIRGGALDVRQDRAEADDPAVAPPASAGTSVPETSAAPDTTATTDTPATTAAETDDPAAGDGGTAAPAPAPGATYGWPGDPTYGDGSYGQGPPLGWQGGDGWPDGDQDGDGDGTAGVDGGRSRPPVGIGDQTSSTTSTTQPGSATTSTTGTTGTTTAPSSTSSSSTTVP